MQIWVWTTPRPVPAQVPVALVFIWDLDQTSTKGIWMEGFMCCQWTLLLQSKIGCTFQSKQQCTIFRGHWNWFCIQQFPSWCWNRLSGLRWWLCKSQDRDAGLAIATCLGARALVRYPFWGVGICHRISLLSRINLLSRFSTRVRRRLVGVITVSYRQIPTQYYIPAFTVLLTVFRMRLLKLVILVR